MVKITPPKPRGQEFDPESIERMANATKRSQAEVTRLLDFMTGAQVRNASDASKGLKLVESGPVAPGAENMPTVYREEIMRIFDAAEDQSTLPDDEMPFEISEHRANIAA